MDNLSHWVLASEKAAHFLVKFVIYHSIQAVLKFWGGKVKERREIGDRNLGGEIAWVKWSQIFMGQQKKHGDMVGFKIHV